MHVTGNSQGRICVFAVLNVAGLCDTARVALLLTVPAITVSGCVNAEL